MRCPSAAASSRRIPGPGYSGAPTPVQAVIHGLDSSSSEHFGLAGAARGKLVAARYRRRRGSRTRDRCRSGEPSCRCHRACIPGLSARALFPHGGMAGWRLAVGRFRSFLMRARRQGASPRRKWADLARLKSSTVEFRRGLPGQK